MPPYRSITALTGDQPLPNYFAPPIPVFLLALIGALQIGFDWLIDRLIRQEKHSRGKAFHVRILLRTMMSVFIDKVAYSLHTRRVNDMSSEPRMRRRN